VFDVRRPTTWRDFFWQHGPFFTSIASVFIALCALFLTIYYANLEREYKELAIRPFLHLDVETVDFHVGFLNTGLGPAQVKNIALKFSGPRCTILFNRQKQPDDTASKTMGKVFDSVLKPIDDYFADPLAQLFEPSSVWEPPQSPKLYTRTITPGEVIAPNQEIIIFQLQKDQMDIANRKLQTLNAEAYNDVIRRFVARANGIPYYLYFCSLTGAYCVNQIEENCGASE
jgi:hypothetical protein